MRVISVFLLCSSSLLAQSAGVPRLGWVEYGEPGRLLPVSGVAGAAQLDEGAAWNLAGHRIAALQPSGSLAVLASDDGAVLLARIGAGETSAAPLEGAIESPRSVVWSPSGDALLAAGGDRLQIWQISRSGQAALSREIPVSAEDAAVSDGGSLVLARMDGVLYLIAEDGAMQEVSRNARGPFTFLAGSRRFAWLESDGAKIGGDWGEPLTEPFRLDGETVQRFVASPAPRSLLLAESGGGGTVVQLWTEERGWSGHWRLPAHVQGFAPTGAPGVLRLLSFEPGPLWMADAGALQPSVFFVPAGQTAQDANGGDQ